jgi:hypothetical protein
MVHYVGGPLDGRVQLVNSGRHPFVVSVNTDTDGYYGMEYQVAGQRIGVADLELTSDDVIARWHQRSSADDFMTGDIVIVKETGVRAMAVAPMSVVYDDGTTDEGWSVSIEAQMVFVKPDEIRIATAQELNDQDGGTDK